MYSQGDILLIPIPFSDPSSSRKRAVLVLSDSYYNQKTEDLIVAAITSNLYEKEYSILFGNEHMKDGTLRVLSSVRFDKIYTISRYIIIRRFGSVNTEIVEQVKAKLLDLLDEKLTGL